MNGDRGTIEPSAWLMVKSYLILLSLRLAAYRNVPQFLRIRPPAKAQEQQKVWTTW